MARDVGQRSFGPVAPYYDVLMRSVPYERWADYIEHLLDSMPSPPDELLDLCCGTGSLGMAMARRGYTVTGIDLSEPMIERAAANAARQGTELDLAVADACDLPFSECFDAVVSVFDSLNYITEEDGLRRALHSASRALRPGGLLGFDVNTLVALEEELFTQSRTAENEPLRYRWLSRWDPATRLSTIKMHFEWQRDGECLEFDEVHTQRGHSDKEIRQYLEDAGFRVVAAYTAYTFHELTDSTSRAFYLATRRR